MSWSEDDWGKPFFPTRFGSPQGHATERKMLDAVGGFDGIRTKIRTNPDGSTTILKTRGGMPVFTTTPAPGNQPIYTPREGVSVFFCTPSSTMYQSGYTPPGAVGPVSRWFDWHIATAIPAQHGGVSALTAFAAYEKGADGVAKAAPGSITWYGNVKLADNIPVVLSWHGGGIRAGRYDKVTWSAGGAMQLTKSKISTWNYVPSCVAGFVLNSDIPTATSPPSIDPTPYVWVGGVARVKVVNSSGGSDIPVFSAAVRETVSGHELLVISESYVFSGDIPLLKTVNGAVTINPSLDGATVNMSVVCEISLIAAHDLIQWPYINASGTKAVVIVDTYTNDSGLMLTLYEADLATGTYASVPGTGNLSVHSNPASLGGNLVVTGHNIVTPPGAIGPSVMTIDRASSSSQSATTYFGRIDTETIVAADYVGDQLAYLTCKSSRIFPYETVSISSDFAFNFDRSASAASMSASNSSTKTSMFSGGTLELVHSVFGTVFTDLSGAQGGATQAVSYSGSFSAPGAWHIPFTNTTTTSGAAGERQFRLYNADLRKNSYLFSVFYEQTVYNGSQWANGHLAFSNSDGSVIKYVTDEGYSINETTEYILRTVGIIGGEQVFSDEANAFEPVSNSTSWTGSGYSNNSLPTVASISVTPAGATTSWSVETGFAYTFWDQPGYVGQQCPKIAHLAQSNDGAAAYVGLTGHTGMFETSVKREAFIFGVVAPRTVAAIPSNKYVPGSDDTLASPVFFPKLVKA